MFKATQGSHAYTVSATNSQVRHKDAFGRVEHLAAGREHYLRPRDGRLVPIRVQNTGTSSHSDHINWDRTGRPKMRVSMILRFTHWIFLPILDEEGQRRELDTMEWIWTAVKWVPSCVLLVIMVSRGSARSGSTQD